MRTSVIGFPRIGKDRELKFASEKYFAGKINEAELLESGRMQREYNLKTQKTFGIDLISSNDFSFYDNVLDTAFLFNAVPQRYKDLNLPVIDTYFAAARGYQGANGNVKALAMKKWFNTNYHYIVPEIDDDTVIELTGNKPVEEFLEAKALGIDTKVDLIGPFTFLKLARYTGSKKASDFAPALTASYIKLLEKLAAEGAYKVQFDEPYLVRDLGSSDIALFEEIYKAILSKKGSLSILLQTYFGDIRDVYKNVAALDFDAIGIDFVEGRKSLDLVKSNGFPKSKILVAGVVNGKNIWR
ncbi:MAG: 5-methyltetrahydropteroyltriglutamate--homocysteine S-methyltransferase, partial [Clostridiales bacterium]|nr:5-methyltetrahydropteroyltriglutamate--homocysteine S-methyltransferase [Clostridiales bacterium]